MKKAILALDFGGSGIKYGVWCDGRLEAQSQVVTPKKVEDFLKSISEIKEKLGINYELVGCACSTPGIVNQEKKIIEGASAIRFIHDPDFCGRLEKTLKLPLEIENDANCAALAEVSHGAAAGMKEVLVLVIGSGIGGALIHNGKLHKGHHLFGGEFGFMLLDGKWNFSQLATPVAMAKRVSTLKGLPETTYSGKEVFDLAEAGDGIASKEVQKLYYYLAVGLYNLQTSFDPEVILIGGGISAQLDLLEKIEEQLDFIFDRGERMALRPKVKICQFKNEANLIGAVANFYEQQG